MLLPSRSWLGSGPWRQQHVLQGKISSISAEISKNLNTHLIITGGPFFFTWIFIKSTLSLSSLPPWDLHICQFSPTFMCKTFQKQNDNNNINNDNNTKMNSTNSRYQNTVLNRHFSSAFSEISGLQRCNYHVLHTPNCTWSSPPPHIKLSTWSANTAFSMETQSNLHSGQKNWRQWDLTSHLKADPSSSNKTTTTTLIR